MANWRYNPRTGTYNAVSISDEIHTIAFDTEANAYGIRLNEAPQRSSPSTVTITETASGGSTFTEISSRTAPSSGQFWVDYDAETFTGTGFIEFNAADSGTEVSVDYYGLGSVVKDDEVPRLSANNTFTGNNTFSGNDTLSGTKAFTGASTFSGSATFTGTTLFGNNNIAIFSDVKSSATAGGALDSSSTNIRDLNTTVVNNITGCSLASNKVTLPAGTYYVRGSAPAWRVDGHQIKLYNDSDSSDVIYGTAEYSPSAAATVSQTSSKIEGYFTIASSKDFEIRHYVTTTRATNGAGVGVPSGNNVTFATIFIQKVA